AGSALLRLFSFVLSKSYLFFFSTETAWSGVRRPKPREDYLPLRPISVRPSVQSPHVTRMGPARQRSTLVLLALLLLLAAAMTPTLLTCASHLLSHSARRLARKPSPTPLRLLSLLPASSPLRAFCPRARPSPIACSAYSTASSAMADDTSSNPLLADFDFPPFDRVEPAHVRPGGSARSSPASYALLSPVPSARSDLTFGLGVVAGGRAGAAGEGRGAGVGEARPPARAHRRQARRRLERRRPPQGRQGLRRPPRRRRGRTARESEVLPEAGAEQAYLRGLQRHQEFFRLGQPQRRPQACRRRPNKGRCSWWSCA
uniref:Uncharacterized protein n=1 Tax=Aegilops tauschii subsp. strangulata TaxID=200361 RepID=A0A453Q7E6_AEGTS